MDDSIKITHDCDPQEVEIPAQRETFEAQVLVMAKAYKVKYFTPIVLERSWALERTRRVIATGKFRVELVPSGIANGKPTLIISEEEQEKSE